MTEPIATTYTPEQIRAMDSSALTRLAFQLGLAPSAVYPVTSPYHAPMFAYERRISTLGPRQVEVLPWSPATEIEEADAVFRQLRARDWSTEVCGNAEDGWCRASKDATEIDCCWPSVCAAAEALALLRCAVLAMTQDATG